ncbi:hypothetical protein A2872_03400 [Candidatus Gottesmanbacteria bacterium RIFCSPHIGHO2_01_FULL_42_12]|uniref:Uncharacterized protein n=1 Tax=Candidatus Gottesmanbacteria bacterium RIFCSPHIGHO2_01_FULL_42_12 TaxID=1798377 RepID=A0A1F5Z4Q7_9BACT|nr:MAG: hypothetical protein A2872_03400 [Candidatus Gottesmanbacteria bacterium RIFCSPHIGHO2_01_FULL_42_12]
MLNKLAIFSVVAAAILSSSSNIVYAQTIENRGWDPGLKTRRIATFKIDATYFEDCPDEQNGCYGTIPSGGGFYTLSPDLGDLGIACRVNSGDMFYAGLGTGNQTCPFYFHWGKDQLNQLSAVLTTDTSNWTTSYTPHIYLGFQENLPIGNMYFGGKNLPLINNFNYEASISAIIESRDPNSLARFLVGTAWYVPSLDKSFVLELNLDNMNVNAAYLPEWDINQKAVTSSFDPANVKSLYLGGRYWGYNFTINSGSQVISIDWTRIVSQLIEDGYLPPEAMGPYPAGIYTGPEIFGKIRISGEISNARMYSRNFIDIVYLRQFLSNFSNIFDYNFVVGNFGK